MSVPDPLSQLLVEHQKVSAAPKRQRNRWLKVLAAIGGGSVLFCCISLIITATLFGPSRTDVGAEVKVIAEKIAPIQIPAGFEPDWGASADNTLWLWNIARFEEKSGRGLMLLGEIHIRAVPNPDELKLCMKFIEDSSPELKLIDASSRETKSLTLRGGRGVFEIVEGEARASTTKMRQISGTFPGKEGTAVLILQGEVDFLSREAIDGLLKSFLDEAQPKEASEPKASEAISPEK